MPEVIYAWPTWPLIIAILLLMIGANEIGFRAGSSPHQKESESSRSVSNALKASIFGLVAFLLGFSFSITTSRHEARRKVVLDEANAIGTCYLRAELLPSPFGEQIQDSLREYVQARLDYFDQAQDPAALESNTGKMNRLTEQLWEQVEGAVERNAQIAHTSQIIPAANEVIDLHSTRAWVAESHLQPIVLMMLLACVLVSSLLVGHSSGQAGRRHVGLWLAFNVLFSMVLFVVLDFDRPSRGLVQVNHGPMRELLQSMNAPDSGSHSP